MDYTHWGQAGRSDRNRFQRSQGKPRPEGRGCKKSLYRVEVHGPRLGYKAVVDGGTVYRIPALMVVVISFDVARKRPVVKIEDTVAVVK